MKFAHFFPLTCAGQMNSLDLKWFREKKKTVHDDLRYILESFAVD